jgi:hypothetical protein
LVEENATRDRRAGRDSRIERSGDKWDGPGAGGAAGGGDSLFAGNRRWCRRRCLYHHLSRFPDAPSVDVLVDDQFAAQSLPFAATTGWLAVPGGEHHILVVPTGQMVDVAAIDVAQKGGDVLVQNLAYPDESDNVILAAGAYDFESRSTGTNDVILEAPTTDLAAGNASSLFVVGSFEDGTLTVLPIIAGTAQVSPAATPVGTPMATPVAAPMATPIGTPMASPEATPMG